MTYRSPSWDPHGETTICDVNTVMSASRDGGLVSRRTIGSRAKFAPSEIGLDPLFLRIPQDHAQLVVTVLGANLTLGDKFIVKPLNGAACEDSSVRAEILDLSHARMTVSSECFRKPGVISISPVGTPDYYAPIQISVASRRSPVLHSVTPTIDRSDPSQPKLLALTLRGRGFTKESNIYIGYGPGPGALQQMPQLVVSTMYVSPTELRAELQPEDQDLRGLLEHLSWTAGLDLRVWVVGSDERHELSDFRDVNFDEARYLVRPKTALITSVSPYPIKPMNENSPEELAVTIRGENFLPEDKVVLDFGHFGPHELEVRSQYVSPTVLRAWIPRNLWRKHQITYRLVVETMDGQQYSSRVDASSEEN